MKTVHTVQQLNIACRTAVAIGYFDGMHLGHRKLIGEMVRYAEEKELIPVLLTFDMSGFRAAGKGGKDLFPRERTNSLAEEMGVELFVDLPFEAIHDMGPETFCEEILSGEKNLYADAVFCGEDFRFGKNRSGSVKDLKALGEAKGFSVVTVDEVIADGEVISTTRIKNYLENGNIKRVNLMLGMPYSVSGEVVHGNHLAKGMGFPTANIHFPTEIVSPKKGVYLTETLIGEDRYRSITNIGTRPTITSDTVSTAETHILDFDGDLYGQNIKILFYEYVRQEQKFSNVETLKRIVLENIEYARKTELKEQYQNSMK